MVARHSSGLEVPGLRNALVFYQGNCPVSEGNTVNVVFRASGAYYAILRYWVRIFRGYFQFLRPQVPSTVDYGEPSPLKFAFSMIFQSLNDKVRNSSTEGTVGQYARKRLKLLSDFSKKVRSPTGRFGIL